MEAHRELLTSVKEYLDKREAYENDGSTDNWNEFADADRRLDAAIKASEATIEAGLKYRVGAPAIAVET